jgi:peptidoglycan/xylan/chitin deacetylase (PgdA/CDA1 family)
MTGLAGLSIDLDSVASHLEGYGYPRPRDNGAAYTIAVPRILELLARTGARATFFLIAEEAREHPGMVRRLVEDGHEVASHSMTHPLPFRDLDPEATQRELSASKALLEDLAGLEVVAAGYRYDGSSYPSILLPLLRASVAWRGNRSKNGSNRIGWSAMLAPRQIHRIDTSGGSLIEVPMFTVRGLRLPYYHTLRFVLPDGLFRVLRRYAQAGSQPVWYQLHAVDFLSLSTDRLDRRIACHPGMELPLSRKLDLAADAVRALGQERTVIPLRTLVENTFGPFHSEVQLAGKEHG